MRHSISDTAEYGDLSRGPRIIDPSVKKRMKEVLSEIQKDKGSVFAREWIKDAKENYSKFYELRKKEEAHPVEQVGKKLRSMMKWL